MKLHNYQEKAIKHVESCNNPILSIGCGLGKTAAMLHYIDRHRPRTLCIVAPKRVAETVWKQEAAKWGLQWLADKLTIVSGSKKKRDQIVMSYDYLVIGRDNLQDVAGLRFDLLVLDELTSFKNHTSKRSEACYSIKADKKIGLTGTFLTNGAIDCFGQFCAVGIGGSDAMSTRERNGNFYKWRAMNFRDTLAGSGLQFQSWKLVRPLSELLERVQPNIFTLDSKDWLEIPKVQYIEHYVELTAPEMNEYLRLNTMLNCHLDGEVVSFSENQKFAKLQTLCNGFVYGQDNEPVRSAYSTKLDEVVAFVDQCAGEGEQVLLFYAFKEEKQWLEEKLKAAHLKFTDVKNPRFMQKWEDGEVDVLLAHPASAGHGLNLQNGGRICVWSTITYDFELWAQANARLARQGQQRGVQIHTFMAAKTVELKKYKALREKGVISNEFVELTK